MNVVRNAWSALRTKLAADDIYAVVLALVAVTLPIRWIKVNSVTIILLTIFWILNISGKSTIRGAILSRNFAALSSIFVVFLFSVTYSSNIANGFSQLEAKIAIILLPLVMLTYNRLNEDRLDFILAAFLVGTLISSLLCLVSTIYLNFISGRSYVYYYSWYYSSDSLVENFGFHPSYFSIYCSFCIFIALSLFKKGKIGVTIASSIVLYLVVFQLLLASRIGILAFIILSTLTILFEAAIKRNILTGLFYVLCLFLAMAYAISNFTIIREKFSVLVNYNVNEHNEGFKIDRRFYQWNSSLEIFKENPLIGVGIGDLKGELRRSYLKNGFVEGYENSYNAHNLFLETAASTGLVGVFALLGLWTASFYIAIKSKSILYLEFLLLFFLLSAVESVFSVQKGTVFFCFFNTLFMASVQGNLAEKQRTWK
jgi:O-antigen ligase